MLWPFSLATLDGIYGHYWIYPGNTINLSSLPPHLLKLKVGAASAHRQECAMEHAFMLYRSAKESLNAKSLPLSMQAIWFSYHTFLWHPSLPLTYLLTFNELSSLSSWCSLWPSTKHKVRHSNMLGFVLQSRYSPMDSYMSQYLMSLMVQTCESSFQILLKHVAKER